MRLCASRQWEHGCYSPWRFACFQDKQQKGGSGVDPNPMIRANVLESLRISIRAALAAGLAVAIAQGFRLQFPIYALIAAVIVTDVSASRTRQLALPRLSGTLIGALLGVVVYPLINLGAVGVGVSILASMFIAHLLRFPEAAKVAGYVCGIVVLNYGDDPWTHARYRVMETFLGIGVAVAVSFVPKLITLDEVKGPAQPSQRKPRES